MKDQIAAWLDEKGMACAAHVVRMYGREDTPVRTVDWMDVRAYLCCMLRPVEGGDLQEVSNAILILNLKKGEV